MGRPPSYFFKNFKCEECDAKIENHYFNKTELGWFIKKDGTAWCPQHIPEWVESWRKEKDATRKRIMRRASEQ